jgi:hypothetical protein
MDMLLPLDRTAVDDAPPVVADQRWLAKAVEAVDRCVDRLVDDFVTHPFRHRVEHSLHVALMSDLLAQEELSGLYEMAGGQKTQLVHKEWPETRKRPLKKGRGNFDIAVLSPEGVAQTTTDRFLQGRIAAPIAIEIGLNYPLKHLKDDDWKLENSAVPHAYLIHFSHSLTKRDVAVEQFVASSASTGTAQSFSRSAFAHHDPKSGASHRKRLDEHSVTPIPNA